MASEEQVFAKVQEILVDALSVEDDEVTPDATLMGDLGAESIDFLDIVFRLEKAFDIKIPRGELFPDNLMSADSGFVKDGKITEEGIQEFRARMPHANVANLAAAPKVSNVSDLFTVDMVCKFIASKIS